MVVLVGLTAGTARAAATAVAAALTLTLVTDAALVLSGRFDGGAERGGDLVSVARDTAPAPVVAPLAGRHPPHLLVAGTAPLPPAAVERARRLAGVAAVTVVDAARTPVGGRRLGLLGVDPSAFRAFAPGPAAESDRLWQAVATGGLAVSFDAGPGTLPLGEVVQAGASAHPCRVRVGAYASLGIGDVDAVVSRAQARALGLPDGNGLLLSAPGADARRLARRLRAFLPRGTTVTVLAPPAAPAASGRPAPGARPRAEPRVTGRPDGAPAGGTPISGNMMTPTMRGVLLEVAGVFGPFPAIGCRRVTGDPQDHGDGRACDFMESTAGRVPSASARRHGDQVAAYAVANAARLGVSYVIWRQHIWNARGGGWRAMPDRGSVTQNHFDHVHISVLR